MLHGWVGGMREVPDNYLAASACPNHDPANVWGSLDYAQCHSTVRAWMMVVM